MKYMWETGYAMPKNYRVNLTKSGEKWYFESNQQPKEMQEALLSFQHEQEKIGKEYTLSDFIKSMNERNKCCDFSIYSFRLVIVKPVCVNPSIDSLQQFVCLNKIAFDEDRYRIMVIGDILGEVVLKKGQTCESMLKEEGLEGYEIDKEEWKILGRELASKASRQKKEKEEIKNEKLY